MIKIGHAVGAENGSTHGEAGDQTGNEIRIQNWYKRSGGWDTYIEPKDREIGERAADFMRRICESPSFGYSQKNRWDGYKAIKKVKGNVEAAAKGDFDCSSLCISCYIFAGAQLRAVGYTKTMAKLLEASGLFNLYTDEEHLTGCDYAVPGGMYLASGHHVCMALQAGGKEPAPTPAAEYVKVKGSVKVRTAPVTGKLLMIARNELLPLLLTDEVTGWYQVNTQKGTGWITCNEKYTEVVTK